MDIIPAILAIAALAAAVWTVGGRLVTPARFRGGRMLIVLEAEGDAEGLEEAVRGAAWLRDSGRAEAEIVIADCGLSAEGLSAAERLAGLFGAELRKNS